MKLEVNITKTRFFALFGAVLLLAGAVMVYASSHPGYVGHTPDQIDWSQPIPGDSDISGDLSTTGDIQAAGSITASSVTTSGTITADGLDVPNVVAQNPAPPASNWICTATAKAGHGSAAGATATCPAGYIAYSGKCEMLWQPSGGVGCASTIGPVNGNQFSCYFYTCDRDSGSTCHSAGYRATAYCIKIQ